MTTNFKVHDVQLPARAIGRVLRPRSVVEALAALDEAGARPMAGGTDLLLELQRGGPGPPVTVVDLTTIEGFASIDEADGHFRLSGGVRHNQVVQHTGIIETALPLAQACLEVGSPQLRNRATIAGNLATASPANDTISALMALGATVEISHLVGGEVESRLVRVADFFTGFRQTVLQSGELITALLVPKFESNQRGIWVKLGLRRAQAISVVHAGMVLTFDDTHQRNSAPSGKVVRASLAMGSVAPTVVQIPEFNAALEGELLTDASITAAADAASSAVAPISDGRATADYRIDGISTLIKRALSAIATGEQASMWPDEPATLSSIEQLDGHASAPQQVVRSTDEITIELNGTLHSAAGSGVTLLDWVRDSAGATGMKEGCAEGECGACTMLIDGAAAMSCLVTAAQADGARVVTVEGLSHPIQQAFVTEFAVQCGFCIPGFLVAGARLIEENDDPTDAQIVDALAGNLCRCTGYYPIIDAIHEAAVAVRAAKGGQK